MKNPFSHPDLKSVIEDRIYGVKRALIEADAATLQAQEHLAHAQIRAETLRKRLENLQQLKGEIT